MSVVPATYLVAGLALLVAAVLPPLVRKVPLSAPMVLVSLGAGLGLLPMPDRWVDPQAHRVFVEHLSEICVLVSLLGVGLALDRPLSVRRWRSFADWSATWRLLGIAMPLTIAGVAVGAHWLMGLAPAAALLLGAALAPTDPVLASDVQVDGPTTDLDDDRLDEEHEVRFGLTAEAGLNDGLAFPFVFAAIFWASRGAPSQWAWQWLAWDLVGRVLLGVLVGLLVGWLIGTLSFRAPRESLRTAQTGEPIIALACVALSYGLAEVVHGYGFLAVFVAAVTMRRLEPQHDYHHQMHHMADSIERLLTLLALLLLGFSLTNGLLADLSRSGVALACLLVLVVRPLAGWVSLSIRPATEKSGGRVLTRADRLVMSFFGVRGIGTVYYLAYATGKADFGAATGVLWSTAAFTIVLSVIVHGLAATPVMDWLEKRQGA